MRLKLGTDSAKVSFTKADVVNALRYWAFTNYPQLYGIGDSRPARVRLLIEVDTLEGAEIYIESIKKKRIK